MVSEKTPEFIIRAKSGWIENKNKNEGWYVGYVEQKNNVYFFANYIVDIKMEDKNFSEDRINITNEILKSMQVIK